jgi:uncharacterized membrane protein (UPF0136 family)
LEDYTCFLGEDVRSLSKAEESDKGGKTRLIRGSFDNRFFTKITISSFISLTFLSSIRYLIANNKDNGIEIATATSVLLVGAMGPRALKTRKPVPAGLASLGLASSAYYGFKLNQQINGV